MKNFCLSFICWMPNEVGENKRFSQKRAEINGSSILEGPVRNRLSISSTSYIIRNLLPFPVSRFVKQRAVCEYFLGPTTVDYVTFYKAAR